MYIAREYAHALMHTSTHVCAAQVQRLEVLGREEAVLQRVHPAETQRGEGGGASEVQAGGCIPALNLCECVCVCFRGLG